MNTQNMGTIGGRVKELRLKEGLSQEQLAPYLHFGNKGMVFAFETGKMELSMGALMAYADYFSASTDWILNGKSDESIFERGFEDTGVEKIVELYKSISDVKVREIALRQLELLTKI